MFQFVFIASCSVIEHQWEESGSRFIAPDQALVRCPPELSLLQAQQSQLSAFPHVKNAPIP